MRIFKKKIKKEYDILTDIQKLDNLTEPVKDKKWKEYFEKKDKEELKKVVEQTHIEDTKIMLLWLKEGEGSYDSDELRGLGLSSKDIEEINSAGKFKWKNNQEKEKTIKEFRKPESLKKRISKNLMKRKSEEATRAFSNPGFVKSIKKIFNK
ncbi:hypothetical protein HOA91_02760 [Candidatus Woesearchaeota archaeon]|jgi:hypothetical protein|nr:hypothetical protein [Candidatus Woesearchaeota archaeon]